STTPPVSAAREPRQKPGRGVRTRVARCGVIDRSSRGETWDAGSIPSPRRSRAEKGGVVTFRRRRDGEPDTTARLGRQIRIWFLAWGSLRGAPPAGAGQRLQGGVASRASTAPTGELLVAAQAGVAEELDQSAVT